MNDLTELWRDGTHSCVMVSCCSGAELQLCDSAGNIVLRELYPSKSDLYERAQMLRVDDRLRYPSPRTSR